MNAASTHEPTARPISGRRLVLLALAPGVLTTAVSLLASPWLRRAGLPPLLAMLLASVLCGAGLPFVVMLREARRTNGRSSLLSVIPFRARIPWPRFLLTLGALLLWAFAAFGLLTPISEHLRDAAFAWMPSAFLRPIDVAHMTPWAVTVTSVVALLTPLLVNPLEELYFRGFLLPRMSGFGQSAAYVNTALWAIGHLWQPWGAPMLFIAMLPAVVAVQRTRCVWLIVVGHTLGNFVMILGMVLSGPGLG